MPDTKISDDPLATALAGDEDIAGVQGGGNVRLTPELIRAWLGLDLPYVSGNYYHPEGFPDAYGSAATIPVDSMRMLPGRIRRPVTVVEFISRVNVVASGGNIQMAVYATDPVTGFPTGAPVWSSASISTTGAGIKSSGAISVALQPGKYWFCVNADATAGGTITMFSPPAGANNVLQMNGTPTNTDAIPGSNAAPIGRAKSQTFGTWPTLTGNPTTDSLTVVTTNTFALIAFKA